MAILQKQLFGSIILGIFITLLASPLTLLSNPFALYPFGFWLHPALATEYISPSFKILDPVIDTGGTANSTSSSGLLQLGSLGEFSVGRSYSPSYELRAGFLFFSAPSVAPPSTPAGPTVILGGPGSMTIPPAVLRRQLKKPLCVDLNLDGRVNLADVSILFFEWHPKKKYKEKPLLKNSRADCNFDNFVDITDLSVMLFWWSER